MKLGRWHKILLTLVISLLLLCLLFWGLLHLTSVQNLVNQKLVSKISNDIQAQVQVGTVDIEPFKSFIWNDVLFKDQRNDTLLFIQQLELGLNFFSLFKKEASIRKIITRNSSIYLNSPSDSESANYQFLIDALSPEETKSSKSISWQIDINTIQLENTTFLLNDMEFIVKAHIPNLTATIKNIDLSSDQIHFHSINLNGFDLNFLNVPNTNKTTESYDTLVFPVSGWKIVTDKMDLTSDNIAFPNQMDSVIFQSFSARLEDFVWNDSLLSSDLIQMKIQLEQGLELEGMANQFQTTHNSITTDKLHFKTNKSTFQSKASLGYLVFDDLKHFAEKVNAELNISLCEIDLNEVHAITGERWQDQIPAASKFYLRGNVLKQRDQVIIRESYWQMDDLLECKIKGSLQEIGQQIYANLQLTEMESSFQNLKNLFPSIQIPNQLDGIKDFRIESTLQGTFDSLTLKDFIFRSIGSGYLEADLAFKLTDELSLMTYLGNIKKLELDTSLLKAFLPDSLVHLTDELGQLQFSGIMNGSKQQLDVSGMIQSNPGKLNLTMGINGLGSSFPLSYTSELNFQEFDFSSFTKHILGPATAQIEIQGQGFEENLNLTWHVDISEAFANNYEYKDLHVEGSLLEGQINTKGFARDSNAVFDFDLDLMLQDSITNLSLSGVFDYIDLNALQLYPYHLTFNGSLETDLSGKNWDDLMGYANFKNFGFSNDSLNFQSDLLQFSSEQSITGKKKLEMQTDIMNAVLEGNYKLSTIRRKIEDFLNLYFPIEGLAFDKTEKNSFGSDSHSNFKFSLVSSDISTLSQIFNPGLTEMKAFEIQADFDSNQKELKVQAILNGLKYNSISLDSLKFDSYNTADSLINKISVANVSQNQMSCSDLNVRADMANDILQVGISFQGEPHKNKVSAGSTFQYQNGSYLARLDPKLLINNKSWNIHPKNLISLKKDLVEISQLELNNGTQHLSLGTKPGSGTGKQPPLKIDIADIDLAELSSLFFFEELQLGGLIQGNIELLDLNTKPYFKGNIYIDKLAYQSNELGDFNIFVENNFSNLNQLDFRGSLKNELNDLTLTGNYILDDSQIQGTLHVEKLEAKTIEYFSNKELKNTTGQLLGKLEIRGTVMKPVVIGVVFGSGIQTSLIKTDTPYRLDSIRLSLQENLIDLGEFEIFDKSDHVLKGAGNITHQYFKDFNINLQIESDEFEVMDKSSAGDQAYFGNIMVKSKVDISGPINHLIINMDAKTLPGTNLGLHANAQNAQLKNDNFIIFQHPDQYYRNLETGKKLTTNDGYDFDFNANIELTPEAELVIQIDPDSGDELRCRGNANLAVNLDADGDLNLIGDYIFLDGSYAFNYEGLVKKDFEIKEGSSLNFLGKVEKTKFNLTSIYRAKTSIIPLIQNQTTLSDDERKEAIKPVEIEVQLLIKGTLEEPKLSFQISAPNAEEGRIGNAVSRKLTQLNENPDELNRQVFGILFFNSFFAENNFSAAESIGQSMEDAAFSSLRGMLTNQLNSLASKYVKAVEISFDMDTYHAGQLENSEGVVTELGVSVSKELFNDRLSVRVGSNVNFNRESSTEWSGSDFSAITGDFVLEYKLNEKGNYLVKVFHLNDYDIIDDENDYKTGVGFVIRKKLKDRSTKENKK